jgi:hypothetical protein
MTLVNLVTGCNRLIEAFWKLNLVNNIKGKTLLLANKHELSKSEYECWQNFDTKRLRPALWI